MTLIVKPGFNGMTDADAIAYVNAVETADEQLLEFGVGKAINDFVVGCKLDGTWSAIKASCILAGARTLTGALVPLVGTAPTNFNFVAGDYNRETGLVGDGSTKYLNSNRNNNADPQNSKHVSVYSSNAPNSSLIGLNIGTGTGATLLFDNLTRLHNAGSSSYIAVSGFIGISRNAVNFYSRRNQAATNVVTVDSATPQNGELAVFRNGASAPTLSFSNSRLAFYSIGESLDLALLDARVSALITAFGVAIP
jgi:hypothetical protein